MTRLYPIFLLFQTLHLFGQNPVAIPGLQTAKHDQAPLESCTNYAGTATDSTFIGQSNDHNLNTVFLCFKDSLLIHHLGDAVLSGDPQPGTIPGVAYAFYQCPPTITGPTLQDISIIPGPGDPCLLAGAASGLYVTPGIANGSDTWFFNNGTLQNAFNMGQPMSLYFAPITLDDYQSTSYEVPFIGAPPGPCVHANKNAAFEVVYLNEIKGTNVDNHFGDDCIGRFTAVGGLPEYDPTAIYTIDIWLASDPNIKAQVMTPQSAMFHLSSILFSTSVPGIYIVSIEDGKSCGTLFTVDMSGCDPFNNVVLDAALVAGTPGETACVPIVVENFNIISGSFSLNWDPTLLQYEELSNFHPSIAGFFNPNTAINVQQASIGKLGLFVYNTDTPGALINIPDGEALFSLCLEVLDTPGVNCIPVEFSNSVTGISIEDAIGQTPGITMMAGGVCQSVATLEPTPAPTFRVSPNPVDRHTRELSIWSEQTTAVRGSLFNAMGAAICLHDMELQPGANRFNLSGINLPAGLYYLQLITPDGATQTVRLVRE